MQRLVDLLKNARYCVAFTGAGVSTLSGIRDFRGKNGIYKDHDADKIFDFDYFRKDPSFYYTHARDIIYNLEQKEPSIVHTELARLESEGIVKAVITQNIDLLHQKAGSRRVIELHGSPTVHSCLSCGKRYTFEEICPIVQAGNVPSCTKCGGMVKPNITFFGEALDPGPLEDAAEAANAADLMLVLGSSLVVQPAASIPRYTIARNGTLVIVNDMPTPMDSYATLRYESLEGCFGYIRKHLR